MIGEQLKVIEAQVSVSAALEESNAVLVSKFGIMGRRRNHDANVEQRKPMGMFATLVYDAAKSYGHG